MKKFLLTAVIVMMATMSVNAQNGYDDTKHEVALSYGLASTSQVLDVYEEVIGTMFGGEFENESWIGPISAEYYYHVKNWLGVGGIFVYGHCNQDMYTGKTKVGKDSNNYFTIMPSVKFDWLRKKNFGLYSKLAFGATYRSESVDYDDPADKDDSDSKVHINWQASLLGVEGGSPYVRGFLELGFGEQGIFVAGVRYKF